MKTTMYSTGNHGFLRKTDIFNTDVFAPGAVRIVSEEKPLRDRLDGFGVAITGASCYELSTMSPEARDAFLSDIYGENGLGLRVGRISVGSSDYSAELYSYDDVPNDLTLSHFSVEKDEAYVIPMLREVIRHAKDIKLLASPWSPPGWMKTGGSMCGGHMRDRFLDLYVDYFFKFIEAYEARGIHIEALTPQNEPHTEQNGAMPACNWNPDFEARFVLAMRKKLTENGYDTAIRFHDHNFSQWNKIVWMLEEYPELLEASGQIALHYYTGDPEMLLNITDRFPDIKLYFTEGGPNLFNNYDADWCKWGLLLSRLMNLGVKSFLGWNLLLDETGGPNIGPFFCGGLATLNSQTGELTYSGQYHAFNHFSRFIKAGAEIYRTTTTQGKPLHCHPVLQPAVECVAARNPDGSFVLQVVNPDQKNKVQLQYEHDGKLWYIEALPNTVNTVIFEK